MTVLFKRHFQLAYLADDAKVATDILGKHYGIKNWDILDMVAIHGVGAPSRYTATAWLGDTMIEVIEPDESIASIYQGWTKGDGSAFRFHHLGFLVDSFDEFEATKKQLADNGCPVVLDGSFGEILDYAYADTTAVFGHYYEIIHLKSQGDSFFGRIPQN